MTIREEEAILKIRDLVKRNREIGRIICRLTDEVTDVIVPRLENNINDIDAINALDMVVLQLEVFAKDKSDVELVLNKVREIKEDYDNNRSEFNNEVVV